MVTAIATAEKLYTVAEWLELEKTAEVRHEFYYGKLIPMAGEAKKANRIASNLLKIMDDHLFQRGFDIFDHDIKAQVVPDGIYRYPDLVVAPIADDEDEYIVKHPVLLVEVASGSSGQRDRVKKRKEYFAVESLWYYLIVQQDEMSVTLHQRGAGGQWETRYFTEPEEVIEMPRFELSFPLSSVYARLKNIQS